MSDSDDDIFKKKKPKQKQKIQQQEVQQHKVQPKVVLYCQICTLPVEYCYLNKQAKECQDWLMNHDKALYELLHSKPDVVTVAQTDEQFQEAKVQPQQEQQPQQQAEAPKKKKKIKIKETDVVTLLVTSRNKSKYITSISGLVKHGIDLKDAKQKICKKFGCGAVVQDTKIDLQGDLSAELEEWLPKEYPQITEDMIDIKEK